MLSKKLIKIENIGLVLFQPSSRAKRFNVSIKPFIGVRVTFPTNFSFKQAVIFAKSKTLWIRTNMEKIKELEKYYTDALDKMIKMGSEEVMNVLTRKLNELATKHSFNYNNVYIRNQKSIWGSCSGKNDISLNSKLILLPKHLINFAILHELVHTEIKNHSSKFWSRLTELEPNTRFYIKQLSRYYLW